MRFFSDSQNQYVYCVSRFFFNSDNLLCKYTSSEGKAGDPLLQIVFCWWPSNSSKREVMTNDDTVGEAFENQETRWSEIVDDNVTLGVNTTISWEIFRARMKWPNSNSQPEYLNRSSSAFDETIYIKPLLTNLFSLLNFRELHDYWK